MGPPSLLVHGQFGVGIADYYKPYRHIAYQHEDQNGRSHSNVKSYYQTRKKYYCVNDNDKNKVDIMMYLTWQN
jgi:hypothetical protein